MGRIGSSTILFIIIRFKNLFLNDYAVNPKEIDYVYNVLEI